MTDKLTPTQRKSLSLGKWQRRKRTEGEALGQQIAPMRQPVYVPPTDGYMRPGSDHSGLKSVMTGAESVYKVRHP